jgi:hypothetical protein
MNKIEIWALLVSGISFGMSLMNLINHLTK